MFCSKCGAELKDGAKFCVKCGNPLNGQAPGQQMTGFPQQGGQQGAGNNFSAMFDEIKQSTQNGTIKDFILSHFNIIALAGALLMFIGLFPDFMSVDFLGATIGAPLIKGGDGVIVLIVTLICAALATFGMHKGTITCAVINLVVILIDVNSDGAEMLDVGAGFVIILIGTLVTIGAGAMGIMYAKQGKKLPLQK